MSKTGKKADLPKAPKGLKRRGAAFYRAIAGAFDMDEGRKCALLECARCLDAIDGAQTILDVDGWLVVGARGQKMEHPAATLLLSLQRNYKTLWAMIGLDGAADSPVGVSTEQYLGRPRKGARA